jgi:hypothetical protein
VPEVRSASGTRPNGPRDSSPGLRPLGVYPKSAPILLAAEPLLLRSALVRLASDCFLLKSGLILLPSECFLLKSGLILLASD